jgi:hypothetical protein
MHNHRLSLWRLGDGTVWKHLGSQGTEPGQITCPMAVAVTGAGALVVTDDHRVQVLTVDGAVLSVLDPTAVVGVGRLGRGLFGAALYPGTDEILVTDCFNHRVVALSWSPEVCYYGLCCLYPAVLLVDALPCDGGSLLLSVMFSVDYWMRGHLAVKAQNWAISAYRLVLQSHQWGMCG